MYKRSGSRSYRPKTRKYNNLSLSQAGADAYAERNRILIELGYKDYKSYLRSKFWKAIRKAQLARQPECYGCGKKASQVHHGHYSMEILRGDTILGLYSICGRCHKWIEISKSGYKRSPEEATTELFRIKKIIGAKLSLPYRRPQHCRF